jgi:DnaJ family protein B protein 13
MTTAPADKLLTIQISAGWKEGTKIVFEQEGDQGPNKIPGNSNANLADIIFTIKQKPHPHFTRKGDDLHMETEVPLIKALTGYSLEVETLDQRLLRIPINDTIK